MAGKRQQGKQVQKKHYCVAHDSECQAVRPNNGKRMRYRCAQGCDLRKLDCVLK